VQEEGTAVLQQYQTALTQIQRRIPVVANRATRKAAA